MEKSIRPKARPADLKENFDLERAMSGASAKREAQDERTLAPKKPAGVSSSPRPRTKSDFETDHAIGQSVKYQKCGGKVSKMAGGGMCRGMGAATKGGSYKV